MTVAFSACSHVVSVTACLLAVVVAVFFFPSPDFISNIKSYLA